MRTLLAALLLAAAPAFGATPDAVRRGDLTIRVRVTGTVVPEDVFRLKSTIDGRVESVLTGSDTWRGADQPLAFLAHRELAAMIDARGSQSESVMEDRWQHVYRPTPIRCPDTCYVLRVFVRPKSWLRPQSLMFEAASKLKMIARVRPEDVPLVHDGQTLTFWPVGDPSRRMTGRVARFRVDVPGVHETPGGSFTLYLSPTRSMPPGTMWEGEIVPRVEHDVLMVPTAALIQSGGEVYLPVRVSTGVTTPELTQITAGVPDKREILVLDDAQLHGAKRHVQEVDRAALRVLERQQQAVQPAAPAGDQSTPAPVDDTGYGGQDPYGDQ